MPEELQLRNEHSRSMEDAETLRAIETLKNFGLLIPVSEADIYHGRVASTDVSAPFEIRPDFNNAANSTGNSNINQRPVLYTGTEEVATQYAKKRSGGLEVLRQEVHPVTSLDSDSTIIDPSFDPSDLSEEDLEKYNEALTALLLRATEGSPLAFDERETIPALSEAIKKLGKFYITIEDVTGLAAESGVSEEIVLQMAGALNTRKLFVNWPGYLVLKYLKHPEDVYYDMKLNGIIINFEYLENLLRKAHIIGVMQKGIQSTLGKNIDAISIFDLDRATTKDTQVNEREEIQQKMGGVTRIFEGLPLTEKNEKAPLLKRLEDLHAKPKTLVEDAKKVEGYSELFEADAGNWEGYTLEEHTETVLSIFDENFADSLPVELLTPMRLALLVHDIGKPIAAARGEKHQQKKYNIEQAEDFMSKLEINEKIQKFILAIIGESQDLVFQIFIRGAEEPQKTQLRELAATTIAEFTGSPVVSKQEIDGFIELCRVLQVCDGGAYTSMATTTRPIEQGGTFRNAPSFNASYGEPVVFGSRDVRLRSEAERPAQPDLTPHVDMDLYRTRLAELQQRKQSPAQEAA